jgi:2-desacetyl-2-hydroxyethyl bacteriochlorophyllide A dehydrogenase
MPDNPTVVFTAPREVVLENREVPSPGPGDLLIRTRASLISTGTELTILEGKYPPGSAWARYGKFPFMAGYDNIGEVVGVGLEVGEEWIGRRVATQGNHTQYLCLPAALARPVRPEVSDEQAAFFTIAEIVMNGVRRGGVTWGEAVVVNGLGLLGQLAVRFCRLAGARPVFAVDPAAPRRERLPQDDGIVPVDPEAQEVAKLVESMTRGRKADVVFEVTGAPDLIPGQVAALRRQGRFVILSSPRGPSLFDFHDLCNSPSFTIIGAHNMSHPRCEEGDNPWTQLRHGELFFDLLAEGELDMAPLISHRARYTEAPGLYAMLLADRSQAMGVVLEWEK